MNGRLLTSTAMIVMAVAVIAFTGRAQTNPAAKPAAADDGREAILKAARDYSEAFNKGDAKAIAAMWTENGENRDANGDTAIGRDEIEKTHAAFFKANPGVKIELLVKSVRFPAKDLAIEEGLVRQSRGAKEMPSSTSYVAVHVREAGQWKIALSSEGGGDEDRLDDLDWLLGDWTTKTKVGDVKFSFAKDPKKAVVTGTFTRTPTGKEPVSGSIRIAFDPETGSIRSWGFEDDGAHSQSLWRNDGKSWLIDLRGVLADGTPFSETIVLQRVAADAITWRSIDRVLDDEALPDTKPMKLTRAATAR